MVLGAGTYQYHLKDHLGNTRAMFSKNAGRGLPTALAQATDYYPFGKSFENNNVDKNRYLYNGKEFQEQVIGGTQFGWYDYGARFYDPEIGRWHSVDPLADEFPWQSSYLAFDGNPINKIDPTGMSADWFQNELTGDVYYNSELRKGDEGTGAMTGSGWVHMGENGMFSEESDSDFSVISENSNLGEVSHTLNTDKPVVFNDAKVTSVTTTAMFKGDNAGKFMSKMGYSLVPKVYRFETRVNTTTLPEGYNKIDLPIDDSFISKVYSSQYIANKGMTCNTEVLKGKTVLEPKPWGTKEHGTTIQKDTYTRGISVNWGTTWNVFDKTVDWRSGYQNQVEKVIKRIMK